MDTKKSTLEDLAVLGGAFLVFCAIAQGSTVEPAAPGVEPIPIPTPTPNVPEPIVSVPGRVGFPRDVRPL